MNWPYSLQWRHNERHFVSDHQLHDSLLNRFFQTQINENIKALRHWPLCGKFTGTGEFPAQITSNAENISIWWRHHVFGSSNRLSPVRRNITRTRADALSIKPIGIKCNASKHKPQNTIENVVCKMLAIFQASLTWQCKIYLPGPMKKCLWRTRKAGWHQGASWTAWNNGRFLKNISVNRTR